MSNETTNPLTYWTTKGLGTALRDLRENEVIYVTTDEPNGEDKLAELRNYLDSCGEPTVLLPRQGYVGLVRVRR